MNALELLCRNSNTSGIHLKETYTTGGARNPNKEKTNLFGAEMFRSFCFSDNIWGKYEVNSGLLITD